jgi:hypothetical protein
MVVIGDILVSDEVVSEKFVCNLNACKGACCWEGDFGAPITNEEKQILDDIYLSIKPFLSVDGQEVLENKGKYTYYKQVDEWGTPLLNNAACAYLTYSELGIAQCGIEKAYLAGATHFIKPISCHLYPIRVRNGIFVVLPAPLVKTLKYPFSNLLKRRSSENMGQLFMRN